MWRVGIDIGGTFTDVVGMNVETGKLCVTKVPSQPSDPSQAVAAGLRNLMEVHPEIQAGEIDFFAHGTTVATNAAIEGKGVTSALLITGGFRALYDMRGGNEPVGADMIDPQYRKPQGLVPQHRTFEITERVLYDGAELVALDEQAVREAARACRALNVTSIAVCYLFSFMNDAHEQRTAQIIREEHPDCRVSLSSVILPTIREYVRLSTTVLDAYVGPVVGTYLKNVVKRLVETGINTRKIFIMQSNGGLMQIEIAAEYPNQTLLSGPAAGGRLRRQPGPPAGRSQCRHLRHRRHQHRHQRAARQFLSGNAARPDPRPGYRHADDPDPRAGRRRRHDRLDRP